MQTPQRPWALMAMRTNNDARSKGNAAASSVTHHDSRPAAGAGENMVGIRPAGTNSSGVTGVSDESESDGYSDGDGQRKATRTNTHAHTRMQYFAPSLTRTHI